MLIPRTWLEAEPPEAVRRVEVAALLAVFADAFDVRPPSTECLTADEALYVFREFTAACMEAVLAGSPDAERWYARRLGRRARRLGEGARAVMRVREGDAMAVTAWFYRGIGIDLLGQLPGDLCFARCYFAGRYSCDCCRLMAHFDEGFMHGICGGGSLAFSTRATSGAPVCDAVFSLADDGAQDRTEPAGVQDDGMTERTVCSASTARSVGDNGEVEHTLEGERP